MKPFKTQDELDLIVKEQLDLLEKHELRTNELISILEWIKLAVIQNSVIEQIKKRTVLENPGAS